MSRQSFHLSVVFAIFVLHGIVGVVLPSPSEVFFWIPRIDEWNPCTSRTSKILERIRHAELGEKVSIRDSGYLRNTIYTLVDAKGTSTPDPILLLHHETWSEAIVARAVQKVTWLGLGLDSLLHVHVQFENDHCCWLLLHCMDAT